MAVSVTLQSALVGAGVLLSIMSVERLPDFTLPSPMPPLPAAPRPVQVVAAEIVRTASAASSTLRVFTAPSAIPKFVAMISDEPAPVAISGSPDGVVGMPSGLYSGASTLLMGSSVPPPPAERKQAAENKPDAPATRIMQIGGNVLSGKLIRRVMPVYPLLAVRARISGTVRLLGVVSREGTVRELKVIDGHPLLIPAALEAVRQWVYSPTYLNGEPVEVMAPIEVHFTLGQ